MVWQPEHFVWNIVFPLSIDEFCAEAAGIKIRGKIMDESNISKRTSPSFTFFRIGRSMILDNLLDRVCFGLFMISPKLFRSP